MRRNYTAADRNYTAAEKARRQRHKYRAAAVPRRMAAAGRHPQSSVFRHRHRRGQVRREVQVLCADELAEELLAQPQVDRRRREPEPA